ncbi:MAG: type IV pilus assembly protein PilM [Actinomycetota bacterium]
MARRLIGLDIGTNAVTIAEVTPGSPPRLELFGQVALPRDAMREGEVVDDFALTDALARLRDEVGVRRAGVRLGIASPRVIVRQVEMPLMTRDELASALKFQAQDLIPIPIDEAVLDFSILGTETTEDGEVMRVLLAAAQEATIMRLVAAVEAAGMPVDAVDLVPLALIRSLAHPVADNGAGAEGIVSFGGGVTAIAVHEGGVPRFVRVLGTAGRELTDAIANELDIPPETAEALKRQLGTPGDDLVTRANSAIERPLAILLDEVRSSLDYYRNQPGAARLLRVVVTGGGSQLPGLADRLGTLVGVPVEVAEPRAEILLGDIRFSEDEYPRLDPYLPAAVGLALGGSGHGTVIDLMPTTRRVRRTTTGTQRNVVGAVAAGAAAVVLLGGITVLAQRDLSDKKDTLAAAQATNTELQQQVDALSAVSAQQAQLDALTAQVSTLLRTDVSWARMLQEIGRTIPDNVWLTTFQGQVNMAATETGGRTSADDAAAVSASVISGAAAFEAMGVDYPDVAVWLENLGDPTRFPSFTNLWVSSAELQEFNEQDVVGFTSTATVTDAARSDRLEKFEQGGSE